MPRRRRGKGRRRTRPGRGSQTQRSMQYGKRRTLRIAPRVSNGVFRLQDGLKLSSGASGNMFVNIDRSISQFAESAPLRQMYNELRLVAFEVVFNALPLSYAGGSGGIVNSSFVCGTNLTPSLTAPASAKEVLAQGDAVIFNCTGRVSGYRFRSAIPSSGYLFTTWIDEQSFAYAGCPGTIQVANTELAGLAVSADIFTVVITGVYELTSRTYNEAALLKEEGEEEKQVDNGKVTRSGLRVVDEVKMK